MGAPGRPCPRPGSGTPPGRGATDRRSLRGGPRGCAPRRWSPRRAAPPRRSTPRAPTPRRAGSRHHRRSRQRRHAGPSLRPARHLKRRSAELGRRPGGLRRPSALVRAQCRGRRHPRAPRACRARHRLGAADVAVLAATTAPSAPSPPSNQPRRRLGAPRLARRPRPALSCGGPLPAAISRRDRHAAPHRPGGSCRSSAAGGFAPGHRRDGRPAVGLRHPVPGAPVGPAAPIAGNSARRRTEPVPIRPIPRARCRARHAAVAHRHHADHASGRRGRSRRRSWLLPCRSGYLRPDDHQREAIREEGRPGGRPSSREIRRRPTLPGSLLPSTIGAGGLNFRVRYGNGCDPSAMATEICCQLRSAPT